jgi:hypothetical protein
LLCTVVGFDSAKRSKYKSGWDLVRPIAAAQNRQDAPQARQKIIIPPHSAFHDLALIVI